MSQSLLQSLYVTGLVPSRDPPPRSKLALGESDEEDAGTDEDDVEPRDFYDCNEDTMRDPSLYNIFVRELERIPSAIHHVSAGLASRTWSDDERDAYLSEHRIVPELEHVDHHNRLLVEAGTWSWPTDRDGKQAIVQVTMPACKSGDKCVAMTQRIHGFHAEKPGIVLVAYMSASEWAQLPHHLPVGPRWCLLCYRFYCSRLLYGAMHHRSLKAGPKVHKQWFRVLVDAPGGYKNQHVLRPNKDQWLGFAHPIVRFEESKLSAVLDEQLGKWRIDQSAIVWTEGRPATPSLEQTLSRLAIDRKESVFRRGSSHYPWLRGETGSSALGTSGYEGFDPRLWLLQDLSKRGLISYAQVKLVLCCSRQDLAAIDDVVQSEAERLPKILDPVFDRHIPRTTPRALQWLCSYWILSQAWKRYQESHPPKTRPKPKEWVAPWTDDQGRTRSRKRVRDDDDDDEGDRPHSLGLTTAWGVVDGIFCRTRSQLAAGRLDWTGLQRDDGFWPCHPSTLSWSANEWSIQNLGDKLIECDFWHDDNMRDDDLIHAIGKTPPQPSQVREIDHIFISKSKRNPEVRRVFVDQWLTCSLLGGYRHCSVALSNQRRAEWFDLWTTHPELVYIYVRTILRRHKLLGMFIAREYVVYLASQEPAFAAELNNSFDWSAFCRIVISTMDRVRLFINQFGWSGLVFAGPCVTEEMLEAWSHKDERDDKATGPYQIQGCARQVDRLSELVSLLKRMVSLECSVVDWRLLPCEMKRIVFVLEAYEAYRARGVPLPQTGIASDKIKASRRPSQSTNARRGRKRRATATTDTNSDGTGDAPDDGLIAWLSAMAQVWKAADSQAKSHKRKSSKRSRDAVNKQTASEDMQFICQGQSRIESHFFSRHQPSFLLSAVAKIARNSASVSSKGQDEAEGEELEPVVDTDRGDYGIRKKTFHIMMAWLSTKTDLSDAAQLRYLKMLPAFGADASVPRELIRLFYIFDRKTHVKTYPHTRLAMLKDQFPESLQLASAFANIVQRCKDLEIVDLGSYLPFQLAAIRKRAALAPTQPIPEQLVCFYFCPVCHYIYSLYVVGAGGSGDTREAKHVRGVCGYAKPVMDYEKDVLYCNHTKVKRHEFLPVVKLRTVILPGKLLRIATTQYYVCPECGLSAQWRPDVHAYSKETGLLLCGECSIRCK